MPVVRTGWVVPGALQAAQPVAWLGARPAARIGARPRRGRRPGGRNRRGRRGRRHGLGGQGAAHAAQQTQLRDRLATFAVHLQGFGIGLPGQLALHIAQVAVQGRIAGVGLHARFQGFSRVFQPSFGCVKHPQVVVGFDDFRVGLHQFAETLDGFVRLAELSQDHAFQEADLHIPRVELFFLLHQSGRLLQLTGLQGLSDVVGRGGAECVAAGHGTQDGQDHAVAGPVVNGVGKHEWIDQDPRILYKCHAVLMASRRMPPACRGCCEGKPPLTCPSCP